MKIKSLCVAVSALITLATTSQAAVLATWTFETSVPATAGPFAPEVGAGTATGFHTSASAVYSNPAGNGSIESYSSNFWSVGDYYQFETSSLGESGISISFDQNGSGTGPRDFKLQYSTNGTIFLDFTGGTYSLPAGVTWNAVTAATNTSFSFDLSSIPELDNDSSIFFRLTNTSTVSINGGAVATTGTGRVDNVTISSIPEPTSALLGALGFIAILRRRRQDFSWPHRTSPV